MVVAIGSSSGSVVSFVQSSPRYFFPHSFSFSQFLFFLLLVMLLFSAFSPRPLILP